MRVFLESHISVVSYKPPQAGRPQITTAPCIIVIIIYNYFLAVCWLINFNEALSAVMIVNLPGICGINVYPNRNNVVKLFHSLTVPYLTLPYKWFQMQSIWRERERCWLFYFGSSDIHTLTPDIRLPGRDMDLCKIAPGQADKFTASSWKLVLSKSQEWAWLQERNQEKLLPFTSFVFIVSWKERGWERNRAYFTRTLATECIFAKRRCSMGESLHYTYMCSRFHLWSKLL